MSLLSGTLRVCGEVSESGAELLTGEDLLVGELREKAVNIDVKLLGQLAGCESLGGVVNDICDGLLHVSETRETDAYVLPDPKLIELHNLW